MRPKREPTSAALLHECYILSRCSFFALNSSAVSNLRSFNAANRSRSSNGDLPDDAVCAGAARRRSISALICSNALIWGLLNITLFSSWPA